MRLLPSDPDVETIVSRIKTGDIDLQPDFQRGEVWSKVKKQRLVDSILRDWHVPPIHVIENPLTSKQEVLDGQQRLAAVRDFVAGEFPVDGDIEPLDHAIRALDGKRFRQLPEQWRRRFNQFTIRVFRIVDYQPSEPAELFFRLNQPASLTGAEQRNAFFGPVREQIKTLVEELESNGISKHVLGFTNSRMAYDDVLSRTTLAVERNSLAEKITSADLTALYRRDQPLTPQTVESVRQAVVELKQAMGSLNDPLPRFNKATLFSWLIFLVRAFRFDWPREHLGEFLSFFELARKTAPIDRGFSANLLANMAPSGYLFAIYDKRSSARVADVSSVILRDAVIAIAFKHYNSSASLKTFDRLNGLFQPVGTILEDDILARRLLDCGWGKLQ